MELNQDDQAKMRSQMHVRTGYANVTKSSEQIGRNTSNMAVKQHKKHQVVDTYFSSKIEEMQKEEELQSAAVQLLDGDQLVARVLQSLSSSKEQEQQMIESYQVKCQELDNIERLITQDRAKKFKPCLICGRLFANMEHLKKHEKESKLHKDNVEKLKFAQGTLLL
ncbi:hypothetical protein FGO68_gene5649 [Halteria grandinella]|uniref:C2H2-type domain-containing protein n=1 Tax=Halteria grandinella TaxID=5974 RepID=A0A8J8SW81_HALGN|nr:hypothetical protein FGO68_gene5649 [Halteria grandinella]